MKKILVSYFIIILTGSFLSGCKLFDDTKASLNNLYNEANKTKDKIIETVEDIENATKKLEEAKDSVYAILK